MEVDFYKKAADYWSSIPATLEGVLGGFGFISEIDINGSKKFLNRIFALDKPPHKKLALDCGAGIGRVTQGLLIDVFDRVDLVEQNPKFLDEAKNCIEPQAKIGELYPVGLQDFKPTSKYDVIWCQWVLGHLNDVDLINFFILCKYSLNKNGIIVVKENITSSGCLEKDEVDSSVTRPLKLLLAIFKKAKLKIIKEFKQSNFPKGIYPVYMFALRDIQEKSTNKCDKLIKLTETITPENLDNKSDLVVKELSDNLKGLQIEENICADKSITTLYCVPDQSVITNDTNLTKNDKS